MTILDLVFQSGMGCLYVYEEGALIHLCLVSNELNFLDFLYLGYFQFFMLLIIFKKL
jgi:hypothetical protein